MTRSSLRRRFKVFTYAAAHVAGVTALWRWLHRDCLTCLVIHGIGAPSSGDAWTPIRWRIRPVRLDAYLGLLKRYYTFVDARTALDVVRGVERVRYPLLLTIDDGYCNAVREGLPIFRKHGVRPIVFVVTGQAETQTPFWFDRFDFALQKVLERGAPTNIDPLDSFIGRAGGDVARAVRAYIQWTRRSFGDDRERRRYLEEVIAQLEDAAGARLEDAKEDPWAGVLDLDGIREALGAGIDFGSHTVNHYRLGDLPDDVVAFELRESRAAMGRITGGDCRVLCFPEGSFDERSKRLARDAGYDCGFTSAPGLNAPGCDPLALKRIHLPPHEPPAVLLARVCGLEHAVHGLLGRIKRTAGGRAMGLRPSPAKG